MTLVATFSVGKKGLFLCINIELIAQKLFECESYWAVDSLCNTTPDTRQGHSCASCKHKK